MRKLIYFIFFVLLSFDLNAKTSPPFSNIIEYDKPKDYGTTKSIEGKISSGMKVVLIDDVITTGNSVINGIKQLKDAGLSISDVYVIINRLEGASNALKLEEVNLYQLTDVLEITKILFQEKLVSKEILDKINNQISQN